jgi:hypothetical protein
MCEHHRIGQLADIEPLQVAAYIEALGGHFEKPTVKQAPGSDPHAVRLAGHPPGGRHQTRPMPFAVPSTSSRPARPLDAEQARKLLDISTPRPWSGCATGR